MSKKLFVTVPNEIYEILDRERQTYSMSAFVAGLLATYADVVRNENLETENMILPA